MKPFSVNYIESPSDIAKTAFFNTKEEAMKFMKDLKSAGKEWLECNFPVDEELTED